MISSEFRRTKIVATLGPSCSDESILKDDETLALFKANAYEHAKKFSIQNILPVYEEVYKSCYKIRV